MPFWPNNLVIECLTSAQSTIEQGHSHITSLAHLLTGPTPFLLGPSFLTTLTKDRFKGPTLLKKVEQSYLSLML